MLYNLTLGLYLIHITQSQSVSIAHHADLIRPKCRGDGFTEIVSNFWAFVLFLEFLKTWKINWAPHRLTWSLYVNEKCRLTLLCMSCWSLICCKLQARSGFYVLISVTPTDSIHHGYLTSLPQKLINRNQSRLVACNTSEFLYLPNKWQMVNVCIFWGYKVINCNSRHVCTFESLCTTADIGENLRD